MSGIFKDYKYYNSLSLPLELRCRIIRLELPLDGSIVTDSNLSLYVSAEVFCNQISLTELPVTTIFSMDTLTDDQEGGDSRTVQWNYTLSLPVKIRDLSLDAVLALTVRRSKDDSVLGGTSMRLFDSSSCLKMGRQKLLLYFGARGDGDGVHSRNGTVGENGALLLRESDHRFAAEKALEKFKMAKVWTQSPPSTTSNQARSDWLDRSAMNRLLTTLNSSSLERLPEDVEEGTGSEAGGDGVVDDERKKQKLLRSLLQSEQGWDPEESSLRSCGFLVVELASMPYMVLHEEKQYTSVGLHLPPVGQMNELMPYIVSDLNQVSADEGSSDMDNEIIEFSLLGRPFNATALIVIPDWDMGQVNLAEELNRRLNHNARRGNALLDASVKPNLAERDRLDRLVSAVSSNLSGEDLDLLYRYRYSLTDNKKALTKFLLAVNWDEESEVNELPSLLALWKQKAPVDVADALKMLGKEKAFEHPYVREFAVEVLRAASDAELLTFLLQLVQALRYEVACTVASSSNQAVEFPLEGSIMGINHSSSSTSSPALAGRGGALRESRSGRSSAQAPTGSNSSGSIVSGGTVSGDPSPSSEGLSPLANFLIHRACKSPIVANYLYWYLKVETEDAEAGSKVNLTSASAARGGGGDESYLFETVFDAFIVQLSTSSADGNMIFKRLSALNEYVGQISACQRDAREQGRRREGKEECLRKLLESRNLQSVQHCVGIDWVPLPLDPDIRLTGLVASTASMFASAVYPCVIEFKEKIAEDLDANQEEGSVPTLKKAPSHKIMFKSGDDLRQDQLIMQMIALMDSLLKKVNIDLKLLTYGILAVGQRDGIMEFVRNSCAISSVLKNFGSISEFLRHHCPAAGASYDIEPRALDTFVKSCAGCCVVTYILGIGDRHLDNIMINTSGQMFHIDFGFIFGQDPKPLPPPFRFTRHMADAMGGEDSEHYARFKSFCCQAYNWLRKSASLILNLLNLMGDAGIQDISKRSTLTKVLARVEEKFRLDLNDEQAEQFFVSMINETLHALAPRVMDQLHKVAVSWR